MFLRANLRKNKLLLRYVRRRGYFVKIKGLLHFAFWVFSPDPAQPNGPNGSRWICNYVHSGIDQHNLSESSYIAKNTPYFCNKLLCPRCQMWFEVNLGTTTQCPLALRIRRHYDACVICLRGKFCLQPFKHVTIVICDSTEVLTDCQYLA